MGAQDSYELAEEFRSATGTESFTMVWDETFDSWLYYGITGQPAVVLVDSAGNQLGAWRGGIPEEEVAELISGL